MGLWVLKLGYSMEKLWASVLVRLLYCLERSVMSAVGGDHKLDGVGAALTGPGLGRIGSRVASQAS